MDLLRVVRVHVAAGDTAVQLLELGPWEPMFEVSHIMEEIHCHFTVCFSDHILPESDGFVELTVPRIPCQSEDNDNWLPSSRNVDLRGVDLVSVPQTHSENFRKHSSFM